MVGGFFICSESKLFIDGLLVASKGERQYTRVKSEASVFSTYFCLGKKLPSTIPQKNRQLSFPIPYFSSQPALLNYFYLINHLFHLELFCLFRFFFLAR